MVDYRYNARFALSASMLALRNAPLSNFSNEEGMTANKRGIPGVIQDGRS